MTVASAQKNISGAWELYDTLIEGIPDNIKVLEIIQGATAYMVRSDTGAGICSAMAATWRQPFMPNKYIGMPLKELASCIKSWDYREAGLGLCAINSYYNSVDRLRALGIQISDGKHIEDRAADPFISRQKDIRGKKVTVIGRFPYINSLFAPVCDLSVIEKFYPTDGDYPEQAADYLLPESDFVFVSTFTVVEKTFPRLLKLAKNAELILVGPACPMAPALFELGVSCLSGLAVKFPDIAKKAALGCGGNIHSSGQKISMLAP